MNLHAVVVDLDALAATSVRLTARGKGLINEESGQGSEIVLGTDL